jgi:acetyl-CoA carboxylase carboxyltransferase component
VAVALGPCAGLGALKAGCSHFSIMVKGTSQVFAGGPPVVGRAGMGDEIDKEQLGGSQMHTRVSGVIDNEAESEEHAFDSCAAISPTCRAACRMPQRGLVTDDPNRREKSCMIIPMSGAGLQVAQDPGTGARQGCRSRSRNAGCRW